MLKLKKITNINLLIEKKIISKTKQNKTSILLALTNFSDINGMSRGWQASAFSLLKLSLPPHSLLIFQLLTIATFIKIYCKINEIHNNIQYFCGLQFILWDLNLYLISKINYFYSVGRRLKSVFLY